MVNIQLVKTKRPGTPPGRLSQTIVHYYLISRVNFIQIVLPFSYSDLSGDEGARTPGLRLAKAALSQLSYIPRWSRRCARLAWFVVGLSGLEPLASALSAQRSNHLSYRP